MQPNALNHNHAVGSSIPSHYIAMPRGHVVRSGSLGDIGSGTGSDSGELNAHTAHAEHDHPGKGPGGDGAADHESVRERFAHAVCNDDRTRACREMRVTLALKPLRAKA